MRLLEMDSQEKATLQNCRNCLIEDLDPTKCFLAQLHYSNILTEDQRDRVDKQMTRQDKVVTLMEILPRRGPRAFRQFVQVLKTDYNWISEKMEAELNIQEYTQRIRNAVEERMRLNGEILRDKDYILKVLSETIVPIVLQEVSYISPTEGPSEALDQPLKDLISDHLIPLIKGPNRGKLKLDSLHYETLLTKISDLLGELAKRCRTSLGLDSEDEAYKEYSIPQLIEKRLTDMKVEILAMKKETKKVKKVEEKLTAENQKYKTETKNFKDEVKRLKSDNQTCRQECKKLKDDLKKSKTESEKLRLEVNNLKELLDSNGIDLRISSEFLYT
ncbi:uncharacterized protein LOC110458114 [Mizuhopecten yessoensis]|uniref:Death domain-containing protein CRADD n=1 Tax=Mizuhopecten yessoensis TaxID=6573 RepID=A0A210Q7D0_MIZYE|nr:uncharacterized protein LOC110458114 [Mizuhopecten yessoensis]XP_021365370.1 uncharacterized protein LOC110458114 [Mizuhopecten yessoensis]OWF44625.1 Death domain-containing protein CRADD [Mizuhopecten yessoensis]